MNSNENEFSKPLFKEIVKRALLCKCPKCGKGKIFKSYLKQVDECANCSEVFSHIRTDDGPAWLNILILGHLFALIIPIVPDVSWPTWLITILWVISVFICSLLSLPACKAFFIGIIWRKTIP